MLADTDAIRRFGHAGAAQADTLAAVAAALAALPVDGRDLGPVGAVYVAALMDAARSDAQSAEALGGAASHAARTAAMSATGYGAADRRAAARLDTQV